jgi:hypothetical protein
MADLKSIIKDMAKQRKLQGVSACFSIAGIVCWLMGIQYGAYIAALFIILFAVATIKWIDDEEAIDIYNKK